MGREGYESLFYPVVVSNWFSPATYPTGAPCSPHLGTPCPPHLGTPFSPHLGGQEYRGRGVVLHIPAQFPIDDNVCEYNGVRNDADQPD